MLSLKGIRSLFYFYNFFINLFLWIFSDFQYYYVKILFVLLFILVYLNFY